MAHLFFSYAHADADRLLPIHARMELITEHSLWLDKIGLERGTAWENSIKAAIDDCYGVIFAVTKTFITRPFILNKEIPWAFDRFKDKQGVQLFPILFDDVELPDLLKTPYITQLIDARDGVMERVYDELKQILPPPQAGNQPFVVSWPRLPNFKGRDQLLMELHHKMMGEGRVGVKTAGLHGTGGIGKTQLAVEYAHRYRYYYPAGVYWLNAAADWRQEIADCAVHLDRSLIERTTDERVLAFREHLAAQENDALLVLDNVADPAEVARRLVAPKLTLMDICQQTRTRLLVTTRKQTLDGFVAVSVDVLAPLDARAVLLDAWVTSRRNDAADVDALDSIAESLGYLPLALAWMTAALQELLDLAPGDLLAELRTRGLDDLVRELQRNSIDLGTPEYHDRLVATALSWQLSQLKSVTPVQLLALTAAYGEAAIVPLERLRLLANLPDKGLVRPFPKAIKELQAYNLVETLDNKTALRLHPLTQQYVMQELHAPIVMGENIVHLVNAYRDPTTIDVQTRKRGFSEILEDLRATQAVLPTANAHLVTLIRVFLLAEPHLLHVSDGVQESYVLQQIRDRAYHEGVEPLISDCDVWLENKRYIRNVGKAFPADAALLRIIHGHTDAVVGVLELSDGRILSWSYDSNLRLWQPDGSPGPVLLGHTGGVNEALELSDGRILSRGADYAIRLWQLDGSPGPVFEGHDHAVFGMLELSDGRILSWSNDRTLRLWQPDGSPGPVLEGHADAVLGALELRDGRILSWSIDGTLRLWLPDGSPGPVLEGHNSAVQWALELGDGRILSWASIFLGNENILRLWQPDGSPGPVLEGHTYSINGALELGDNRILSWSIDRTLRLWQPDGSPGPVLEGHSNSVRGALELSDGRILSWADDNTLRLWQPDGSPGPVIEGHTDTVFGALQLRDGRILSWTGGLLSAHVLHIWYSDGTPGPMLKGHHHIIVGALELSDSRILSWSYDTTMRLWGTDGISNPVYESHTGSVTGMLHITDGLILSWAHDNEMRLWRPDGSPVQVLEGHTDVISGALELRDGRILSWSFDSTLRLWQPDGSPVQVLEGHTDAVFGALQLRDGRILSWSLDSTLRLWQPDGSPVQVLEGRTDGVFGALELRDGRILSWANDYEMRLWQPDGSPGPVLEGDIGDVLEAFELSDGRILSWYDDFKMQLWQPDGSPGPVLEGHTTSIIGALELSDGRILSWSSDSTLRLWQRDGIPWATYAGSSPITCSIPIEKKSLLVAGDSNGQVLFLQIMEGQCGASESNSA